MDPTESTRQYDTLAAAMDADLARLGMSQRDLASRMSLTSDDPVTEQVVSMWKKREKIPRSREKRLLEVLGDGAVSRYLATPVLRPAAFTYTTERLVTRSTAEEGASPYRGMGPSYKFAAQFAEAMGHCPELEGEVSYGTLRYRFDYLSPRLAVEVKLIRDAVLALPRAYQYLTRLLVCRNLDAMGASPGAAAPRSYGMVLVLDPAPPYRDGEVADEEFTVEQTRRRRLQLEGAAKKLITEASLLGVEVATATDAQHAAEIIRNWEKFGVGDAQKGIFDEPDEEI